MTNPFFVGLGFAAFGLYLLKHAVSSLTLAKQNYRWPSTLGRITKLVVFRPNATSNRDVLSVEYSYAVNGDSFTSDVFAFYTPTTEQIKGFETEYKNGSEVTVYYDPADPKRSCLIVGANPQKPYSDVALATLGVVVGFVLSLAAYAGWLD